MTGSSFYNIANGLLNESLSVKSGFKINITKYSGQLLDIIAKHCQDVDSEIYNHTKNYATVPDIT